jgi:hypothetical protein
MGFSDYVGPGCVVRKERWLLAVCYGRCKGSRKVLAGLASLQTSIRQTCIQSKAYRTAQLKRADSSGTGGGGGLDRCQCF